jgi:hypothetical protein
MSEQDKEVVGEGDVAERPSAPQGSQSRNDLYAKLDEERANDPDFADVADADHDKLTEVADGPSPEEAAPAGATRKIKVNGKEVEYSLDQIDALVNKGLAADQQFQEAARLRKEAEALRNPPQTPPAPAAAPAEPQVTDDDLALARALQMGSEDEAAKVITKLRSRPNLTEVDMDRRIDQRLTFNSSVQRFQSEYADLFADPNLVSLITSKDADLVARGDTRPYYERYKAIGDEMRTWLGTVKPAETTKQERKASITKLPAANLRAPSEVEDEGEENPSSVISNMAKQRGQQVIQRGR